MEAEEITSMNGKHTKLHPVLESLRKTPVAQAIRTTPVFQSVRTTSALVAGAALVGTIAATTAHASTTTPQDLKPQAAVAGAAHAEGALPETRQEAPQHAAAQQQAPQAAPAAPQAANEAPKAPAQPAPRKPTAAQAIKIATSQAGISEDGAGKTKFQQWYMGTERARQTIARDGGSLGLYADAEWCDMFVSWVGHQVGFAGSVGSDAWTVAHAKWFQQQKRWGTAAKPGAIVFFAWNGSKSIDAIQHVGMVIKDNGNGTVKTVEGNTDGGKVEVKTRPSSTIVGYGYPQYSG
ncbi:CHAP domain-containing protein [Actinomadura harenae]|uniref:CHAP domain-containing protein n=1 Tax=Actinomadura harenae TaxID=2483351 RepID=A0A3M2L691_9ACTN|nr:CHAP domain-containing protein [Actinomadura harenae]RMI33141.1 CHAP domain-containing protein [Actinomadura harenae]